VDNKTGDRDGNARIGHIKGRPGMSQGHMQIEKEKVDHVPIKKTISQVPKNTGEEQRQRDIPPNVRRTPPDQEGGDEEKCHTGNDDEKGIVVLERTEGGAGIGHIDKVEEARDDNARLVGINEPLHQIFGELVERVKRQRQKENEFHVGLN